MLDLSKPSTGLNLSRAVDWSTATPHSDLRLAFREPGQPGAPQNTYTGPRDARGWPSQQFEMMIDGFYYPDGEYRIITQGCNVAFSNVGMRIEEVGPDQVNISNQGGTLRMSVTPTAPNYTFSIIVPGEDPAKTGIWRQAFLDDVRRASVFRTLDVCPANNSPIVNPSDLVPNNPITMTWIDWGPNALRGGWSVWAVIDLARRTGATPWYVMPPMCTAATWMAILNQFKALNAPVILEACNEPWNSQFATQYQWLADNAPDAIKQYAQQKYAINGPDGVKYGTVILHATDRECDLSSLAKNILGDNAIIVRSGRMDAWANDETLYFAKTVLSRDIAKTYGGLAVAPYFGDAWTCRDGVHGFGPDMTLDQLFAGLNESFDTDLIPAIKAQIAIGDKYGLATVAYEGGQHRYGDSPPRKVDDDAQTDPRMGQLYGRLCDVWKVNGGGLMCLYSHCERLSNPAAPEQLHTRWGLKTRLDANDGPKWQTFVSVAATWNSEPVTPPVEPPPVVTPTPTPEPTPVPPATKPPRAPFRPPNWSPIFRWLAVDEATPLENTPLFLRFGPEDYGVGEYYSEKFWVYDEYGNHDYTTREPTHFGYPIEPIGGKP